MNWSLVPFLSECLPKKISDNICEKLKDATTNPISKTESVRPFAIMGIKTKRMDIPAFWKKVTLRTRLLI